MRAHHRSPLSRAGFTLIEVAVSIMILAIAITGTLSVTTYSVNEAMDIMQQATAAPTAKAAMNMPDGWPTSGGVDVNGKTYGELNGYLVHREVQRVSLPADPSGAQTVSVSQITVTVRSRGRDVLQLTTYRHEN